MWVDKKRSWIEMVVFSGSALPHIWMRTLSVTALAIVVTIAYETVPAVRWSVTVAPFSLVGLPLGIFLGFRNNTAYDRWWEGRKLWGQLVNTSRSLTRQIITMIEPQPESRAGSTDEEVRAFERRLVHMLIGYVHALRFHLRDHAPFEMLAEIVPTEDVEALRREENVPFAILQRIADLVTEARRKHWIHPFHVPVIEQSLVSLTDIQGGCERIKSTPMPFSYTVLMHRIVGGYCVLLPFGLMDTVKWATPVVVLVISYCFFGLDAIGEELEQPFGLDTNDLPLRAISTNIERNLRRRIGDPVPPAVEPDRTILT